MWTWRHHISSSALMLSSQMCKMMVLDAVLSEWWVIMVVQLKLAPCPLCTKTPPDCLNCFMIIMHCIMTHTHTHTGTYKNFFGFESLLSVFTLSSYLIVGAINNRNHVPLVTVTNTNTSPFFIFRCDQMWWKIRLKHRCLSKCYLAVSLYVLSVTFWITVEEGTIWHLLF